MKARTPLRATGVKGKSRGGRGKGASMGWLLLDVDEQRVLGVGWGGGSVNEARVTSHVQDPKERA